MKPEEMLDELYVFLHKGPDGQVGLSSRNNRRVMALLMLQALQRDSVVYVRCRILRGDDPREAPTKCVLATTQRH